MSFTEQERVAAAVAFIKHHENWLGRMEAYFDMAGLVIVILAAVIVTGAIVGLAAWRLLGLLSLQAFSLGLAELVRAKIKQRRAEILAYCDAKLGTTE